MWGLPLDPSTGFMAATNQQQANVYYIILSLLIINKIIYNTLTATIIYWGERTSSSSTGFMAATNQKQILY